METLSSVKLAPGAKKVGDCWFRGYFRDSLGAQMVKNLPAMQDTWVQSLGGQDPLEKGMATHSSILAWRNPMNRGARWATVYGIAKIRKRLVTITFTFFFHLVLGY